MRVGFNKAKRYRTYKRLTKQQKNLIHKLYKKKMELHKIARTLGIKLQTVQYHIKKMQEYKKLYQEQVEKIKSSLIFSYLIMDELYTFVKNKKRRYYV